MLEIRGITKVYNTAGIRRIVLNNVTINFRESEFAAILGPSGSGKTTLLNIIGGLDHYTAGDLTINEKSTKMYHDKDWDAYRNHRIGFVFQAYNLIPHQTVLQNVRLALTLSGINKHESIRRAKKVLKDVGLEEHIYKLPAQLSGGQMQRVAIARALVNDPDILLADEPTGALDSETSVQIMKLLNKIAKTKLVIMVTHNPELADEYATRIIKLKDGKITSDSNPYDGKIKTDLALDESQRKSKKTKMSFSTAFSLSLKNLLTKKWRTVLVAFAGSIGIIGIALISAISTGFQNYIDKIEEDTLTSYPLMLQKESADLTNILLSVTGANQGNPDSDKLVENQVLTSTLGTVSNNDLRSFENYLENHREELSGDIRILEKEYNVDPIIYTEDSTHKIAKMNPSNLFTSLIGESSLLRNYSTMTSVFQQYELMNLQDDTEILAGRYPENYNELMVVLSNRGQISELLTYSLGFHDTNELNNIVSKIMSGEKVSINNKALELSTEDLMNVDLRLVIPADLYKYNTKYDVYEDMSGDADYVKEVYDNAEHLKIVGVAVLNSEMLSAGSGIAYLPSLVTHIIDESSKTEVVKRQLAEPLVDVFSGTEFGKETNDYNFEFSDLVAVDNDKLARAFNITIDQNAISAKTAEYMNSISNDITADIFPVKTNLAERFRQLASGFYHEIAGVDGNGTLQTDKIDESVDAYINAQDFSDLERDYLIPANNFADAYKGLLKGLLSAYVKGYNDFTTGQLGGAIPGMSDIGAVGSGMSGGDVASEGVIGNMTDVGSAREGLVSDMTDNNTVGDNTTGDNATGDSITGDNMAAGNTVAGSQIPMIEMMYNGILEKYIEVEEIDKTFDSLSIMITELKMKKGILTKVSGLTSYIAGSFAKAYNIDESAIISAFRLNFSKEELSRVVTAMFTKKRATLATNLSDLGYQDLDDPTTLSFYFNSFDGKTHFIEFLDNYNDLMRSNNDEEKVIEYTDATGVLMSSVKAIVDAVSYVLIAFVSISLVVSSIMIGVITYISVYERTKEIGILRAIGASKHNISSIFNAETFIIGLLSGLFGVGFSYLVIPLINLILHHFTGDIPLSAELAVNTALFLIVLSVVLTLIGGLIPARAAAKKDPVEALRSE